MCCPQISKGSVAQICDFVVDPDRILTEERDRLACGIRQRKACAHQVNCPVGGGVHVPRTVNPLAVVRQRSARPAASWVWPRGNIRKAVIHSTHVVVEPTFVRWNLGISFRWRNKSALARSKVDNLRDLRPDVGPYVTSQRRTLKNSGRSAPRQVTQNVITALISPSHP